MCLSEPLHETPMFLKMDGLHSYIALQLDRTSMYRSSSINAMHRLVQCLGQSVLQYIDVINLYCLQSHCFQGPYRGLGS